MGLNSNCCYNIASAFCDTRPYESGERLGLIVAMAKRTIIGLIVTAAIATGVYYLQTFTGNYSNAFRFSLDTRRALAITSTALFVVAGLMLSADFAYRGYKEYRAD